MDVLKLTVSFARRLGELPSLDELRARLRALPGDASPRERARLHLATAIVMQDRREGGTLSALEEARQAAELLSAEGGPALAVAQHHVGRIALALAVGDPTNPPDAARLAEARRFLDLSRAEFEARGDTEALALSAVELASASEREGKIRDSLGLLDAELARATPVTRGLLRVCKYTFGLRAPDRTAEADAAIAAFLREDACTDWDEGEITTLVGVHLHQLSSETRRLAVEWLEARPAPPLNTIIPLRSSLSPRDPQAWIRPEEKTFLLAQLTDSSTPATKRWHTAHLVLCNLPDTERAIRLRCAEILEEAILSPEVHPLQRAGYKHDVAVGYIALARDDRRLMVRAVKYLEEAIEQGQPSDRLIVARSLASAHLALVNIDSAISSPALVEQTMRMEAAMSRVGSEDASRTHALLLAAAGALLRWREITHPICIQEARRIVRGVLSEDPANSDALRLEYVGAWCAHVQGRGSMSAVNAARDAAGRTGSVSECHLEPQPGMSMESLSMLVRVLGGTELASRADASGLCRAAHVRPDAADLLLDLLEEKARTASREYPTDVLETAAETLRITYGGDTGARARRLSALLISLAPSLPGRTIARVVAHLRGPVGEEVEKALRASNVALDNSPEEEESPADGKRAQSLQNRAVTLMDQARREQNEWKVISMLEEARDRLDEAMRLAGRLPRGHRAIIHISAGNARRHLAKRQAERAAKLLDEAVALYREAYPWTAPDSDDRARVAKVLAEALLDRGVAADWEEAKRLLSEALAVRRSGQLRAETLVVLLDTELSHPSRARLSSVAAALDAACEAVENADPANEQMRLAVGGQAVSLLAELVRGDGLTPAAGSRYAERIAAVSSKLREHAGLAALGFAEAGLRKDESRILTCELMRALIASSKAAREPLADNSAPPHLADAIPPPTREERMQRNDRSVLRREEERWRAESRSVTGERRAGYLVGVARLVARRVELGDAPPALLEAAFSEARESLAEVADLEIRAFALSDLAGVWSDHHAASDFARSAKLLEESLRLYQEAGARPRTDTLQYLARTTRFREDLPFGKRLKEAIRMYQEAAREYRSQGKADGYMGCLLDLAEALSLQEDRPKAIAIREAMEVERLALQIARLRGDRPHTAMLLGAMAWGLTQLAADPTLPTVERERHHRMAGPLFEEAESLTEDPERQRTLHNNHLHWKEMSGGSERSVIAARRRQLASIDRRTHAHQWGFAAHNLAELLVRPGATPAEILEALDLYRGALAVRPMDAAPELHWECAHQIGALLGGQRYPGELPALRELGISPEDAYREVSLMLRSALDAGRRLGVGGKLVTAARTLGLIALAPPGHLACDIASAHEALEVLSDVLRVAPEDAGAADAEAEVARGLALAVAKQRLAGASRVGRHRILEGSAAWELVHLALRARGGRHRRLRMRMRRPNGVDPETWTRWRRVLQERDSYAERRAAVEDVQKEAPEFLSRAPSLDETMRWLARSRAAATLIMAEDVMLLILLQIRESGVTPSAVLTDLQACPLSESEATEVLRAAVDSGEADHASALLKVNELHTWLCERVVGALTQALAPDTKELSWSPNGIAAWMPLEALWPDGPRAWTTPCITFPPPAASGAESGPVLLVCADPRAPNEPGALPDVEDLVLQLAESVKGPDRVEVLAGAGSTFGRSLVPMVTTATIVDRPPSREEVLARAQGCRLLLILAHGTYSAEDPAKSHFHLVDADGHEAPLTAEDISERPGLLRDSVVVLLSCESGASGRLDAGPAGLAGALLSVGAQVVIAPLWLVSLGTAVQVGRAVVEHLTRGGAKDTLPNVARTARRTLDASGGTDVLQNAPYVVWCG